MGKKIMYAVFIGVFMAVCLCLSVGTLVFGPSESAANEQLAEVPQIKKDGAVNVEYLSDVQSYVNDRFFIRQELITVDRRISEAMGVSGEASVVLGKNGWLFFDETVDDYTGTDPMSNRELFSAASNVALMEEYCTTQGREFVFVVTPNKNSLYPQYMPNYGVTAKVTDADRFHSLLEQMEVEYVDLFAAFKAESAPLYFAHDSHWNSQGAALGADLINQALGMESSYYTGDFSYKVSHDGDLYAMLYPGQQDPEMNPVYGGKLDYTFKSKNTDTNAVIVKTAGNKQGSLLCYRDSFGILLIPYLADSYGQATFSRVVNYDLTQPGDYVAIELVERNLCYLIQNVPVMPSPKRELELPAAASGNAVAAVVKDGKAPEGYAQIAGQLPQKPDADSCVYVVCDGVIYEAFCMENDGFAVNVPENAKAQYLVYSIGGTLQMFAIS